MPPIDADTPCANCPHPRAEHQGRGGPCIAVAAVHERREYCRCTEFEPLEEAFT